MSLSKSGIPYLTHVWNPVVGCEGPPVPPGMKRVKCPYCWARKLARRIGANIGCGLCAEFVPHLHPERLDDVTAKQHPAVIGLGFMTELWAAISIGEKLRVAGEPHDARQQGFELCMALANRVMWCPQHVFVTPTRCPENIPDDLNPPENWYLLVTCTNQREVDERLPAALRLWTPGRVVLNLEPMCSPISLDGWLGPHPESAREYTYVAGVILGGMSGPMAHHFPLDPYWVQAVRDECAAVNVPFDFKQWNGPKSKWPGGDVDGAPVLDGRIHQDLPEPWARVLRREA